MTRGTFCTCRWVDGVRVNNPSCRVHNKTKGPQRWLALLATLLLAAPTTWPVSAEVTKGVER